MPHDYYEILGVERDAFGEVPVADIEEVVAEGVRLCESHYFLQNARRCQPNRRTSALGKALNVPTNSPL